MSVTYDFSGKRVLVTGGARGIGLCVTKKFLKAGATVIVLDKDGPKLKELKDLHPEVETIEEDLLNWDEAKKKVEAVAPIHHLINNAGIADAAMFEEIEEKHFDKIFGINVKALINMGQAMAAGLRKNNLKGGTVVNVASILDGLTMAGLGLYSCTKASVTALTKVMAVELEPLEIRVNAVRPTLMATDLTVKNGEMGEKVTEALFKMCIGRQINKRLLTVEETAEVILYLSSDGSSMMNGSNVLIDGGYYAW